MEVRKQCETASVCCWKIRNTLYVVSGFDIVGCLARRLPRVFMLGTGTDADISQFLSADDYPQMKIPFAVYSHGPADDRGYRTRCLLKRLEAA